MSEPGARRPSMMETVQTTDGFLRHAGRDFLVVLYTVFRSLKLYPLENAQVQKALDAYLDTVKRFVASAASVGRESQEITDVAASLDEVLKPIRLPDDALAASYAVAGVLQIELTRKQQLLELPDGAARLAAELSLLRREARLLADGAMPPVSRDDLRYNPN